MAFPPRHYSGTSRRSSHQSRACTRCRRHKRKCHYEDTGPCVKCKEVNVECVFARDGRSRQMKQSINGSLSTLSSSTVDGYATSERHVHSSIPGLNPTDVHNSSGPPNSRYISLSLDSSPTPVPTPQLLVMKATSPTFHAAGGLQWSRYLPDDFHLSEQAHSELVELFFDGFAFWGLRGHRPSFDSAMSEALLRALTTKSTSAHYSPMLHNALLAVAMAFSSDPELSKLDTRLKFVRKAQSYVVEEMGAPTLSGVLAFSYLSSFFSGIGERSSAATYFSVCATMSQDLGLGLDTSKVPSVFMSDREKNEREWLYWVIFCQDKCLALHLGRPARIPRPESPRLPTLSHEADDYKVAMFRGQVKLDLLGAKVLETVYYRKRVTPQEMIQLCQEVEAWSEEVPVYWRVPDSIDDNTPYGRYQLMLFLTHAWIKLCIYQPFYRKEPSLSPCLPWTTKATEESDRAATRILILFQVYGKLHKLHQIPVCAVSIAFLAGVIFVYQVERTRGSNQEQVAAGELQKVMEVLSKMGQTWQCAGKMREVLHKYNCRVKSNQAIIPGQESNPMSAMIIGRGSSAVNPTESDSVMDIDPGLPSEFLFLTRETRSISMSFDNSSTLFDFSAFATGLNHSPPTFPRSIEFPPHPDLSVTLQRQPDTPMSFHNSPPAAAALLTQSGEKDTLFSTIATSFERSGGSSDTGRTSPQTRLISTA